MSTPYHLIKEQKIMKTPFNISKDINNIEDTSKCD